MDRCKRMFVLPVNWYNRSIKTTTPGMVAVFFKTKIKRCLLRFNTAPTACLPTSIEVLSHGDFAWSRLLNLDARLHEKATISVTQK